MQINLKTVVTETIIKSSIIIASYWKFPQICKPQLLSVAQFLRPLGVRVFEYPHCSMFTDQPIVEVEPNE